METCASIAYTLGVRKGLTFHALRHLDEMVYTLRKQKRLASYSDREVAGFALERVIQSNRRLDHGTGAQDWY